MEKEHYNKIRLLGVYSALLVSKAFWALWSKEEDSREIKILRKVKDGIEMITTSLGLDVRSTDLIAKGGFDPDRPLTSLVSCCSDNDPIGPSLDKTYGSSSKFVYGLSLMTAMAVEVISFLCQPLAQLAQPSITRKRRELIESEKQIGKEFIRQYALFVRDSKATISKLLPEVADGLNDLQRTIQDYRLTKKAYEVLKGKFILIINSFCPECHEIEERLEKVIQLTEALKGCKSGQANWRKYEQLGIEMLRFLFVPPFKRVIEQSRTEAGDDRRDAVLPNNQYSGFWQLIRDEFDSRHIVCEFKNYFRKTSKDQLNQLRLYLSKPTVGHFGLLFIRHTPSPQLLAARRRAYEESRILILILSDELVKQMLKMRAFTGHSEDILEDLKIQFELSY